MFVMFISVVHWHCLTVTSLGAKMKLIDDNFGCILIKGQQWRWLVWVFYFFIVNIIAAMIIFSSNTVSSCDVSSVRNSSHKHREPGVSLRALSTLLCWIPYFVYCLASAPVAVKLNPISGSTISEAQDCNTAISKCQFPSTARRVTLGKLHHWKQHAKAQQCTAAVLLSLFFTLTVQNLQTQNAYPWESAIWNITWFAKPDRTQLLSVSLHR